jgi:hypothetical protein
MAGLLSIIRRSVTVLTGGTVVAQIPDSAITAGNARGANAVDLQTVRIAATQVASGSQSMILGGTTNTASGTGSAVIGSQCLATGTSGLATGIASSDRARNVTFVFGAGFRALTGDSQNLVAGCLRGQTTDAATPVRLVSNGTNTPGGTNIINLVDNMALRFQIVLTAHVANTSCKEWIINGLIRRGAGVATTTMPTAASIVSAFGDAGLATCTVACTADTTNGGINLTVNGVAATTINWHGAVTGSEVAG